MTSSNPYLLISLMVIFLAGFPALVCGADPDPDEASETTHRIEALEKEVAALRELLASHPDAGEDQELAKRLAELERRIVLLAEEITDIEVGDIKAPTLEDRGAGLGPAASKIYRVDSGMSIGGYGEMLYENFKSSDESGSLVSTQDRLDFLRAILYFGYKFNDRIVFNSEFEFEHATTGGKGEASVEFAYLDFLVKDELNIRAGLVLMPIGFVNELHEPPVFLGARRPYVEQRLIPSTWRENGIGLYGEHGSLAWRTYVTTTLTSVGGVSGSASGFSASGVRGGRSKGSKSAAEDLALSGRLDWTPRPGVLVGASFYSGNSGQGEMTPGGETIDGQTTILDLHAEYRRRGWQIRGLFVDTEIDDVDLINQFQGFIGDESVGSSQGGWYGEIGYDLLASKGETRQSLIPYLRYEQFDTQKEVPAGYSRNLAMDQTVTTIGIAWKPIPQVVVKADWNDISNKADSGVDQFNIALGFLF
jgi:hypothetical protein